MNVTVMDERNFVYIDAIYCIKEGLYHLQRGDSKSIKVFLQFLELYLVHFFVIPTPPHPTPFNPTHPHTWSIFFCHKIHFIKNCPYINYLYYDSRRSFVCVCLCVCVTELLRDHSDQLSDRLHFWHKYREPTRDCTYFGDHISKVKDIRGH